ncbi:hypothetical protein E2986_13497 [Frieseomelitta varia]|uniref:Alcohol dehydrogenase n=1 Tax=Frieseomelitta varia TaxID=561572 RepID=A0A833RET6_9HYME|nr:hypothetical protein E2986_13497 [Frieseomelitta varia]
MSIDAFCDFLQVVTRVFMYIQAVALLDLGDSGGESAAADLNNEFGKDRAIFVVCDVSKSEQLKESFKKIIDTYETLDILVNIAGIMDDADWEIMVDVNYKGIVHATILGLHTMGRYKGGNGGIIVNMSSVAGLEGIPIAPIYGGTQYAIVGFTQSLKVKERINKFYFFSCGTKRKL